MRPSKGYKHGVSIKSLIDLGKKFFPNISHMNHHTDLIFGEVFCTFIFFHFSDPGISALTVCIVLFDGMTVKTQISKAQGIPISILKSSSNLDKPAQVT